jgi:GrpB-like predicted nucleotidyltransferase (UPF0157 family)
LAKLVSSVASPIIMRVDYIGSTSVPGLAAKEVIDTHAIVPSVHDDRIRAARKPPRAAGIEVGFRLCPP